ncbi:MAG: hypothetical protein ACRD9S_24620 [Pyrinomonadaceae bacterium]
MSKHGFTRLVTTFSGIAALAALTALTALTPASGKAPAGPVPVDNSSEKISIRAVQIIATGAVQQAAGSQLTRDNDRIFGIINTKGLNPGWVYTAWFGIFNNPDACATRPCSGADFANPAVMGSRVNFGGRLIGLDGAATYGGFLAIGDTTSAFDGPGLLDPKHAEIHMVLRSHGMALMGTAFADQLNMFNGGCPPNTCMNVQASVHAP